MKLKILLMILLCMVLFLVPTVMADSTHECQGNSCNGSEGGSSSSTSTNTNNNTTSAVGNGGSGSGNASASNNLKMNGSYSHGFSAATGQDSVQLGSLLFGSVAVSNEARSTELAKLGEVTVALYQAGLISDSYAHVTALQIITDLQDETQPDRCLGFIKCGKRRTILNLFKLV